ncbi:MAG TPA: phosphoglycolate phosphatase [Pseudomonadota bacterium]|nr:phosphoglycolate phosphatase [Pseudomonadota bacterium]HRA36879.1 phosphoglycolate phosphatase [Pseudomonadota bacterium]
MGAGTLRVVLFDLDGTLVHTAPDITVALNSALAEHQLPTFEQAQVRGWIGRGPQVLVQRALAVAGRDDPALAERVVQQYLQAYERQLATWSTPFPGAADCLRQLASSGYRLAVVSNALQRFAERILQRSGLAHYLQLVVGGNRLREGKPHPAPLLYACDQLGALPAEALMVGDSISDVEAARAAGCRLVCVTHGYTGERPLGPDDCELIESLALLPAWIEAHQRPR